MLALSGQMLNNRLASPGNCLSSQSLAESFTFQTIEVLVSDVGALASHPGLLNKVRGAMGKEMLDGASEAVRNRQPCTWSPCCASEVFFAAKPSVDIGLRGQKLEVMKPFALEAERVGQQDLLIRMLVFGIASEWASVAAMALLFALQKRVTWSSIIGRHSFVPKHIVARSVNIREGLLAIGEVPDECKLSFKSPLDAERTDVASNPQSVVLKLLTRVALIARWYDARLIDDLQELYQTSASLEISVLNTVHTQKVRTGSGRNGQVGYRDVSQFDLRLSGDLSILWWYLCIGEVAHIGRGAVRGLGRYKILYN